MPNFDINPGVLNNIAKPLVQRSLDLETADNNTALRTMIEDFFSPDSLAETGPYKGVVLRVESQNTGKAEPEGFLDSFYALFGGSSKQVRVKARIPELHSHLPIPTGEGDPQTDSYTDHHIIDMYPTFTAENDSELFSKVSPGEIGVFDFGDRKNYTDPVFLTPLEVQKHRSSPGTNQGSFSSDCSPPTGVSSGKPLPGANAAVNHTGITEDNLRSRQAGANAILFGDSQMGGNVGKALLQYVKDLGYVPKKASGIGKKDGRMFRSGSPVRAWINSGRNVSPPASGKWNFVQAALRTYNPQLVIICLGGNGCAPGQAKQLIDKIRKYAADAKILWIGPPPATKVTIPAEKLFKIFGKSMKKFSVQTGSPPNVKYDATNAIIKKRKEDRIQKADLIESEIKNLPNVFYVNTPRALGSGIVNDPGPKCDGLHMTGKGAALLLSTIKKKASAAPAGTVTPENAQKKPKAPNKSAPAPGNGTSPLSKEVQDKIAPILTKEAEKIGNKDQARQYLLDYAKRAPTPLENIDSYLSRDWVSGFLATDGHVKGMTVDVSQWQPARIEELAAWQNFTSHHESEIPKNPYGVEVVKPGRTPAGGVSQEDVNPMGSPVDTRTLIKQVSYTLAAAAYMVVTGEVQKSPDVKASPAATAAASSGGAAAGGGTNNCAQPVGSAGGSQTPYSPSATGGGKPNPSKYSPDERIRLCKRINEKLVEKGQKPVLLKYLLSFQKVESGNKKAYPGLVRFEPHVFHGKRYKKRACAAGSSACTKSITKDQVPWFRGKQGSGCPEGSRPNPKKRRSGGAPCMKSYLDLNSKNTKRPAFDRAAKYNLEAAFGSTSWGSFQVMGFIMMKELIPKQFNGQIAEFLKVFDTNPDELNADMVVDFISRNKGLRSAFDRGDFNNMARYYNGAGGVAFYGPRLKREATRSAKLLQSKGLDPNTAT